MRSIISVFLTADSEHTGRFDPSLLTQQARMELLVQHSRDKSSVCTDDGDFKPISEWPGVTFNSDGEVTCLTRTWKIDLYAGTVEFQWLPETVGTLSLPYAKTEGLFRAVDFPRRMTEIRLCSNSLKGSVETAQLPAKLVELNLMDNQISGTINLCTLPDKLSWLWLNGNEITGTIDLQNLPKTLEQIDLSSNALFGNLIVRGLPTALHNINVSTNKFAGMLVVEENVFDTLDTLLVTANDFSSVDCEGTIPAEAMFKY